MKNENVQMKEGARLGVSFDQAPQPIRLQGSWKIKVYSARTLELLDEQEFPNLVVNVGGALMLDKLIGAAGTVFSNANAHIGVGNGTAAPAVAQTDLQGASKTRKAMEATFPSRSGQVMTFESIFGTGDANYSWEEIALFNASSGGDMFSRSLISSPFTKSSSISVTATYTLTCP